MFKYFKVVCKCLWMFIYSYFAWIRKYSTDPEKYDINLRFKKVQRFIQKVLDAFNVQYDLINIDEYEKNLKENKSMLLVANHISDCDPLVMIAIAKRPMTFVSKIENEKLLYVGRLLKCIDGVFIDRDDLKQQLKVFKKIKENMMSDKPLDWVIFPEGTRNKINVGEVQEFHYGTIKPAMNSNSPISVFSIVGTQRILSSKSKEKKYPVIIKFDKTFTPEEYKGLTTVELSEKLNNICALNVKELLPRDLENIKKIEKKN